MLHLPRADRLDCALENSHPSSYPPFCGQSMPKHLKHPNRRGNHHASYPTFLSRGSLGARPLAAHGLVREGAVLLECELSPTSMAISRLYGKPRRSSPMELINECDSPERNLFVGNRSSSHHSSVSEYKLICRSPLGSSAGLSPPSSPSPMIHGCSPPDLPSLHALRRATTYKKSPLSGPPLTIDDIGFCKGFQTPERGLPPLGGAESTQLMLEQVGGDRMQSPRPTKGVYVLRAATSPRARPFVYHIKDESPTNNPRVPIDWCREALETQVVRLGLADNLKTYHALSLRTDVNLPAIDTKNMTHYRLAEKVMGLVKDDGLTLAEFEAFAAQCVDCKLYSSRRTMDCSHVCTADSSYQGLRPTEASHLDDDKASTDKPPSALTLQVTHVRMLYDRFHAIKDSTGITEEEMQYLFVVCWRCQKVLTRTAALDHKDETDSWDEMETEESVYL